MRRGDILEFMRLGTLARYRVLFADSFLVTLEVIDAPGLEPGTVIRVTPQAVAAMTSQNA